MILSTDYFTDKVEGASFNHLSESLTSEHMRLSVPLHQNRNCVCCPAVKTQRKSTSETLHMQPAPNTETMPTRWSPGEVGLETSERAPI